MDLQYIFCKDLLSLLKNIGCIKIENCKIFQLIVISILRYYVEFTLTFLVQENKIGT